MTAALKSETRFLGLPKNKTGLFAADTLRDVKPNRHHLNNVPTLSPQYRANNSTNFLLASSEQNHHQIQQYLLSSHEIQQYYPLDNSSAMLIDTSNSSRMTTSGIRDGFRPSTVRHPSFRLMTATTQRNPRSFESRETSTKGLFTPSHGSVRLRSEIDQINGQLKRHGDTSKTPRTATNNRELDPALHSALSFSTSCRLSSASSVPNADRAHQRFTSAITHIASQNPILESTIIIPPPAAAAALPPMTINEIVTEAPDDTDDVPIVHAYQIPQQSNVGSESVFLRPGGSASHSSGSHLRARSVKSSRRSNQPQSVSCPFYVMYLANLANQQRSTTEPQHVVVSPPMPPENTPITVQSHPRKVPVNSRTSTAYTGARLSSKRPMTSPLSMNTYSTLDDDERLTLTTMSIRTKQTSSKMFGSEKESSSMLGDILRTSSLTHT